MKTWIFITAMSALLAAELAGQTYRYTRKLEFKNIGSSDDKLVLILPLPRTNDYQVIANCDTHGGEVIPVSGTEDSCVRYTITGDALPAVGESGQVVYEFDYSPKNATVDLLKITTVFPYDTTSDLVKMYTGDRDGYIDTGNDDIRKAGDSIWDGSTELLDYIRKCFDYVRRTFAYKNPGTDFHTISELVRNGGGDCGNLSSLFISLLRYKKIPARHVVVFGHVWAEFYLARYGWIPADVTLGLFGTAPSGWGMVWSNTVYLPIEAEPGVTFYITCIGQIHLFYPDHKPYLCDETRSQVEIPAGVSMPGFDSRRSGTTVVYPHFPNPISARGGSNPSAMTIRYSLAKPSPVRVTIYNIMGRRVRTLVDAFQDKGEHSLVWNATDDENNPSGSGVYFYRIENGETVIQKKLILVR